MSPSIFAKRVEKAWKQYDEGKFIEMSKEAFLRKLEKWWVRVEARYFTGLDSIMYPLNLRLGLKSEIFT